MQRCFRHVRTIALGIGASAVLLGSGLAPTSAHVDMKAETTAAGSTGVERFFFAHGCEGAATTEVAIAIPDEIATVYPGINDGWSVETVTDESASPATPAAGDDSATGARITEVIYTAERPVPDGFYDELVLQVALPEDAEGQTLYFPVIQTCEEGENAWITIPAEGEDEVDFPAPSITVTAPEEGVGR